MQHQARGFRIHGSFDAQAPRGNCSWIVPVGKDTGMGGGSATGAGIASVSVIVTGSNSALGAAATAPPSLPRWYNRAS